MSTDEQDVGEAVNFQDTLRKLAIVDEGFAEAQAGLGLGPASATSLDAKTVALLQVAACVSNGSAAASVHWSVGRALAAGAAADEIADVLLAIAPVAGLGRIVSAAPDVATALEYDIDTALEAPED